MDIKNFTYGGPGGQARGGQGVLSIQKNKKITRTVAILKSVILTETGTASLEFFKTFSSII